MTITAMLEEAKRAMQKSYSPYSKFKVGVCVRAGDKLFSGCNVENASYPEGNCAEASAIAAMVLAGEHVLQDVVVISSGKEPCTPCGGCRQRLLEFSNANTKVHVCTQAGLRRTYTMEELLPASFNKNNLGE